MRDFGLEEVALSDGIRSEFQPMGLNPHQPVLVMLKLPGDPVAVVKSQMPGFHLSPDQKEAIKRDLRARQDALIPYIQSIGGRVLGEYQVAFNGMKIEIPRANLAALGTLDGVVDMSPVQAFEPDHTASLPLIGVPAVWDGVAGFHGEGVKIAIIDTGIDYTHANFGGPGTTTAFEKAAASSTLPADPSMFGPAAPKVKGGIDLVGDAYTGNNVPMPDPNPLDCNGHGSHVAGTAAGFGVTSLGATYSGPYDTSTFSKQFRIGPGVAPRADLYAVRVFGCGGFTRVVVDALEWAVDNDMDVINMSLGSVFGLPDSASAEASNNAAQAGIVVVASAGNSGAAPYITGSPAVANRAISVAASEALASFPGTILSLAKTGTTSATITVQNSNERTLASGAAQGIVVLRNADGSVSIGCKESEYTSAIVGKLVVAQRGICARVDRAIFGSRHGAAAVAMINNGASFPPLEGNIFDGRTLVTIPFFGIRGTVMGADGMALVAKDGGTATVTASATIANGNFKGFAGFTSGGPRNGDSNLKPDITAPGVSTQSTAVGTGNQGTRLSGTSMASPHVAGVAALVRQAHPTWEVSEIKAAILNTGSPGDVTGYVTRRGGTGLVQPSSATRTSTIAFSDQNGVSMSFGFAELDDNFAEARDLKITNKGSSPATFTLTTAPTALSAVHSVAFDRTTVTVMPGNTATVEVTLNVPVATVGDSIPTPANRQAFRNVAGLITLAPTGDSNSGISLRVAYYLVPRALSDVKAAIKGELSPDQPTASVTLSNAQGPIAGIADFYAWGLRNARHGSGSNDLRAVGVQSRPTSNPSEKRLVFAVNTWERWSSPSVNEFDILLDTTGDGKPDFAVVGLDLGAGLSGSFDGRYGSFVIDLNADPADNLVAAYFAVAPTDRSTLLLPFFASDVGLSPANPRFTYTAAGFSLIGGSPDSFMPGEGTFNAFSPAITSGVSFSVPVGAVGTVPVAINRAEWESTPALGLMIVILDNKAGRSEARLLPIEQGGGGD